MLPHLNRKATHTLSLPQLNGGLNYKDGVSLIDDSQLSDGINMYYNGGLLRTRPAFKGAFKSVAYENYLTNNIVPNARILKNGKLYFLVGLVRKKGDINLIDFKWISHDGRDVMEYETISIENSLGVLSYLAYQFNNDVYVFTRIVSNSTDGEVTVYPGDCIYKLNSETMEVEEIFSEDMYAPIVVTDAGPVGSAKGNGVMFEGYNAICSYYRMQFNTVDIDADSNQMVYRLAQPISDHDEPQEHFGEIVEATITDINGRTTTHTVTLNGLVSGWKEEDFKEDGLKMVVDDASISFIDKNNTIKTLNKSEWVENNMTVKAPRYKYYPVYRSKVFGAMRAIQFGGTGGLGKGNRVFLGGSLINNAETQASIIWSDFDRPLYFPEESNAIVGDTSSKVTAFGKQGNFLVIFKENEVYYSHYKLNENITAEDLENQSIIDYATNKAYFPLIQIHPNIGCDCPDTIQLCNNRLVWTCSNGKIYTLVSQNEYSENNIYELSDMIESQLKKEMDLINAKSCDCDGKYMLMVGNKIYIMDYKSYGYRYVASYSKTEDSSRHIPYWIWNLPEHECTAWTTDIASDGDNLLVGYLISENDFFANCFMKTDWDGIESDKDDAYIINNNNVEIISKHIHSEFQTKVFDFGNPSINKFIPSVSASFGNNGGEPIIVTFITDTPELTTSREIFLTESDTEERSADYLHNRLFRTAIGPVRRLGIKFNCEGKLSVEAISLTFRALGGNI